MKSFRFLDLPAELRNDIYKTLFPAASVRLILATPHFLNSRMVEQCYKFCPLAHTSQQLRQEVLPIYHVSVMPLVRFADQEAFAAFLLTSQGMRNAMKSITLHEYHYNVPIDVYALLKVMKSIPGGTINVAKSGSEATMKGAVHPMMLSHAQSISSAASDSFASLLNDLIAPRESDRTMRWSEFFDKQIKEIWISFMPRKPIHIIVHKNAKESWMGSSHFHDTMRRFSKWAEKVGFPSRKDAYGGISTVRPAIGDFAWEILVFAAK